MTSAAVVSLLLAVAARLPAALPGWVLASVLMGSSLLFLGVVVHAALPEARRG